MEITRIAGLLTAVMLTACHSAGQPNVGAIKNEVPTEWRFNFFTPKALPALVTFAVVIGTDDWVFRFVTLDSTPDLDKVIGAWNDSDRAPSGHWNRIKYPPKSIFFCWDSIIDKKVYETRLTFSQSDVEKMRRPSVYKDYQGKTAYYNTLQIGLAPGGKVAVWLQGIGFESNYRVTRSFIKTLSGDKLELCKGVTRFSNDYEYGDNTKEFIKGKEYPYGNWN